MNALEILGTLVTIASGIASLGWTISKFGWDNILKRAALISFCCVCAYFLMMSLVASPVTGDAADDTNIDKLIEMVWWENSPKAGESLRFPKLPCGSLLVVIDPPRTPANGAYVNVSYYRYDLPTGVSSPICVRISNGQELGEPSASSLRYVHRPTTEMLKAKLGVLRNAISSYSRDHGGAFPVVLDSQLRNATNGNGVTGRASDAYPFGPYVLHELPVNPFNGSRHVHEFNDTQWQKESEGWLYNWRTGAILPATKNFYGQLD